MTVIPREVARRRPANTPVRAAPRVIDGQVKNRRGTGWTITGLFILGLLGFLLAGLILSLYQQAH